MILALVLYILNFTKWSVCFSVDLCPTILLLGIGYTPPDEDAEVPTHFVTVNMPTLRFELQWCLLIDAQAQAQRMAEGEADE